MFSVAKARRGEAKYGAVKARQSAVVCRLAKAMCRRVQSSSAKAKYCQVK